MAKRTKECYLCGEKYTYCPNCTKKDPTWMAEFHEENCKNIFDICTRFNMGMMDKAEAQAALKECDLSNKINFKFYVQNDLAKIFAEDKKVKAVKKEQVVEETKVHEVVDKKEEE